MDADKIEEAWFTNGIRKTDNNGEAWNKEHDEVYGNDADIIAAAWLENKDMQDGQEWEKQWETQNITVMPNTPTYEDAPSTEQHVEVDVIVEIPSAQPEKRKLIETTTERKYNFYTDRNKNKNNETYYVFGYVYKCTIAKTIDQLLKEVKQGGKHQNILWYAKSFHPMAKCGEIFETPCDHMHLLIWHRSSSKNTDSTFHRTFYQFKNKVEWSGEKISSEKSMCQYIQCEPRMLTEIFMTTEKETYMQHCYDTRSEMQEKIATRDGKKEEKIKSKWNKDDWWIVNNKSPQKLLELMYTAGVKDVNGLLLWARREGMTLSAFIFDRDRQRLENELNAELKRHYYVMTIWEIMETRRTQCKKLEQEGKIHSVAETETWIREILTLNMIDYTEFITNVLSVLDKTHPKKNCLYINGPTNSCKSTLTKSIINGCPNTGQTMSSSEFMWNQCINASIIYLEETKVTEEIINEFKRIAEGSATTVNKKFKNGQYIERTPMIACSNYEPWQFVTKEKDTLLTRMFYYKFHKHEQLKNIQKPLNPMFWPYIRAQRGEKTKCDGDSLFF